VAPDIGHVAWTGSLRDMNSLSIARGLALVSVSGLSVAVVATVLGHIGLGPDFDPLALTVGDY
jgi:hypothetical protein